MRSKFQSLVPRLFDKFGTVVKDVIYRTVDSSYIPGGDVDNNFTDYKTRAIQDDKLIRNMGSSNATTGVSQNIADTTDLVLLIANIELPIEPNEGDLISFNDKWYTVSGINTDPADAMWILYCGEGGID